jgi:repressor LexA
LKVLLTFSRINCSTKEYVWRTILLTELEKKILAYVRETLEAQGSSPTMTEIGEAMGIKSKGTVHRYVNSLIEKGFLEKSGSGWRNLALVDSEEGGLGTLPLAGKIAAGHPIEAIEGRDSIDVNEMLVKPGRFVLKVSGDSMVDAGILDGDWVVIESRSSARDGEIVVALVDNEEATLKRLRRGKDGMVELIPENSSMSPMVYEGERVQVQGVLVGVMRTY